MKLKTIAIIKHMKIVNLIFLIGLITLLFVCLIPVRIITNHISPYLLFGFYFGLIAIIIYRGNQYFEYDTAGEVFNLKTKNYGPLSFLSKNVKGIDLPMNKIIDYRFNRNFLRTELELFVRTKKNKSGVTKVKFNMSYLDRKNFNQIKEDLEHIINKNNKIEQHKLANEFTNKIVF